MRVHKKRIITAIIVIAVLAMLVFLFIGLDADVSEPLTMNRFAREGILKRIWKRFLGMF